ncbi:MAG TPA: glycosyltransferase family 4 protein [Anaerolineales bacterium]
MSLESAKWSLMLTSLGHTCSYFSGLSDRPADQSYVVDEAHFAHPTIRRIYEQAFSNSVRPPDLTARIQEAAGHLKEQLYAFIRRFGIQVLVVENALAIPLNIPLGVALTQVIAETGLPTIAHHHDMYWERQRFLVNCIWDYLDMCFPPRLPSIRHVVINSPAAAQLSYRRGISAHMIPNVMDFDNPPPDPGEYCASIRSDLGLEPGEYLLLQPTRIVKRKAIEHSIELVRRLHVPARLVISHAGGDEGDSYENYLREFAGLLGVRTNFVSDIIGDRRGTTADGRKIYALWDVYPSADIITYPSLLEGFGNAFLEAVYFRRPIVVNDYSIYSIDIKPKGFRAIELQGFVTDEAVSQVEQVLQAPSKAAAMAEHNYRLAKRHYSFSTLRRQLQSLLGSIVGEGE